MMFFDDLRPPPPFDPQTPAYKDWLHLNLLDHASGSVGLINVSLHGAPDDPRSRAVGTALIYVPDVGWIGNLEIRGFAEAAIGPSSIGLEQVALAIDHSSRTLLASVRAPDDQLLVRVTAEMIAPPISVEQQLPLGHGWISWYAVPRLTVNGEWTIGSEPSDLSAASAYHDHNWGRWHWGDDLGWEWGCFLTPMTSPDNGAAASPPMAVVFSLTTDRAHHPGGRPTVNILAGGQRRTFRGAAIRLDYDGTLDAIERRLPGALAALHQDHAQVRLPKRLIIHADDGRDCVTLEFTGRSAAQLITGDPIVRGYSFIHEIAGAFTCAGRLGDIEVAGSGLGVFEYVC
jgi:hypothetical protein